MNKNSEESEMTGSGADRDVSQSRRRLVKTAAVAAPVILTLPSGAAVATASAFQCIARDHGKAAANPPAELVESTDGWVREQTTCIKNGNNLQVQEDSSQGSTNDSDSVPCYKLVKYNTNGMPDSSGGPVTNSCYASFG